MGIKKYSTISTLCAIVLCPVIMVGCSALGGAVLDSVIPGGESGISVDTEIVAGDKNQSASLGASQEVKATNIGKVVGGNDTSTTVASAEQVEVTNINIPTWLIIGLFILFVVALLLPAPPLKSWLQAIRGKT